MSGRDVGLALRNKRCHPLSPTKAGGAAQTAHAYAACVTAKVELSKKVPRLLMTRVGTSAGQAVTVFLRPHDTLVAEVVVHHVYGLIFVTPYPKKDEGP